MMPPDNITGEHDSITTVVIVDDQLTSRLILETIIQNINNNINIKSYDNALDALREIVSDPPDLILVDYKMSFLDGVEFIRRFRQCPTNIDTPIIMVTAVDDKSILYDALEAGATDFLTKPVDHYECKVRCRNLLTMRRQQLIIKNRAKWLEGEVNKAVKQIQKREKETLYRLARAGEFKDQDTGLHLTRIGYISKIIALELGMDDEEADIIELAAPMHDIGKIGIPDSILMKCGPLEQNEFNTMKEHTSIGYEILKNSPSPYLQTGAIIALNHHEKFNGEGYPNGFKGDDIPVEARIVAIADVFDALTNKRSYKKAWPIKTALEYLSDNKGKHFDTLCVDAFISNIDSVIDFQNTLGCNYQI